MDVITKDENTCRTCLKSADEGVNLFEVSRNNKDNKSDVKYSEILSSCAGVYSWEGDGLPAKICCSCSVLLNQSWTFITMCKSSDTLLRSTNGVVDIKSLELKLEVKVEDECADEKQQEEIHEGDGESFQLMDEESVDSDEIVLKKRKGRKKKVRTVANSWKCSECNVRCETECRLKKHYKRDHPGVDYTYPCKFCNKVFKRKNDLRIHERIHSGERPYTCDMCGAGFTQWGTLRQHKYAHTGEKPYPCTVLKCKARFASTASLRRHERTHSGEKRHVCELCGRKFICATALRAHHVAHSSQRPYKCAICNSSFKSRLAQRNHQLIHGERTFVCEDCGKEFFVKGNLSKHRKKMHSEGAGTCPICHKPTSDLKEHSAIHSQDLNYHCDICKRGFRHKGILNAHMVLHKNANKYKCTAEGCNKAFYRKNLLDFHFNKTHSKSTPHQCLYCSQGFYRISDLTRHINTFHPNQSTSSDENPK